MHNKDFVQEIRNKADMIRNATRMMPYKRFGKDIPTLYKEDPCNAGYDLFARLDEDLVVKPGEVVMVPLNVATEIPADCVGLIFQRSSTFNKWKVMLTNSVGVIDSLYCGDGDEWKAQFINLTNEVTTIKPGDKVCQAVFIPLYPLTPVETDTLENNDRGGFGTSFDNGKEI